MWQPVIGPFYLRFKHSMILQKFCLVSEEFWRHHSLSVSADQLLLRILAGSSKTGGRGKNETRNPLFFIQCFASINI